MENYDDINFDNEELLRRILKDNNRPVKQIINNREAKDIGDRVTVLDYSSVTHFNGDVLDPEDFENITDKDYFIVIDINKRVEYESLNGIYKQDLVIVNPKTNEQFRVASRHVKIYRRF